ncbi:hypothetical protein P186_1878 [Pyrobaculum ferrireducens]|uniref:Uncharacterized protein n=1 Tax=Pyrobaculum ferrireducens TaxID=1104324 RepID=G7VHI9_9CREN|nr:hypothetical protein P186_1878 [Pyrobaculum ferrireducens]
MYPSALLRVPWGPLTLTLELQIRLAARWGSSAAIGIYLLVD